MKHGQTRLGRGKGFMWLTSPSLREAGTGAQDLEAETGAGTTGTLLAAQLPFLDITGPAAWVMLLTGSWVPSDQLLIRKRLQASLMDG